MAATRKKVIVRKWNQEWSRGYFTPPAFAEAGHFAFLDLEGKLTCLPIEDVKWICFVRDFAGGNPGHPERLVQKSFARRPRNPGIWFRIRLRDDDVMEGLAQNSLSFLDNNALSFTPPDIRSNTQKVMVPRPGICELEILAIIRAGTSKPVEAPLQRSLFKPTD